MFSKWSSQDLIRWWLLCENDESGARNLSAPVLIDLSVCPVFVVGWFKFVIKAPACCLMFCEVSLETSPYSKLLNNINREVKSEAARAI